MTNDPFKPQENVANYTEIREAANALSAYVSYSTRDKIAGQALRLTSVTTGAPDINADTAVDQAKFVEKLIGSTEAVPLWDEANSIIFDKNITAIRAYSISSKEAPSSPVLQLGPPQSPASVAIIPTDLSALQPDSLERRVTAFYHTNTEFTDISSLLTDISAMFCNIIPPTELSLCVPYFDVNIIYPKNYRLNQSNEVTQFGSLSLTSYLGDFQSDYRAKNAKIGYDTAGMEIFSAPQTMGPTSLYLNNPISVSRRGVRVLDPISPLLTLESANVQQVGIGGSLYAQTKIDLKLVLHDRSRLAEIEELVTAQSFPLVNFRITYGWIHPHNNKMTGNVYAKLINAMRVTQDFVVSSVSIGSKDSIGLSISLALVSAGTQMAQNAKVLSGLGKYVPYSVLQPLIKQAVGFRTTNAKDSEKFVAAGSTIVSNTSSAASSGKFIRADQFYEFRKFLNELTSPTNTLAETDKVKQIAEELNKFDISGKDDIDLGYSDLFKFPQELEYGSYFDAVRETAGDTYIADMDKVMYDMSIKAAPAKAEGTPANAPIVATPVRPGTIPLTVALARFVAAPMLVCQPDIDEIRIHTYCFNTSAGMQAGQNIGNFPIILRDLQEATDPKSNVVRKVINGRTTIEQVITLLNGMLNKASSPFYGHSTDYDKKREIKEAVDKSLKEIDTGEDEESQRAAAADVKAEAESKLADVKKTETARNAEYMRSRRITDLSDTSFRPPRIKIHKEVVPAYGMGEDKNSPKRRIVRIHVYDERSAGVSNKANFLVSLMNSEAGLTTKLTSSPLPKEIQRIVTEIADTATNERGETYYAIKNKAAARKFIADSYPTLIIGSDSGIITNASFTSQPAGDVASAYLLTALEGGTTADPTGQSATSDLADDILITPTTISMTMLGNVLITRGQTYFVDFNTGTTLDNTYTVTSVSHTIKPGGFTTSVTLAPVFSATMKSSSKQIGEVVALLRSRT
jgi:hypothetical protein